MDGKQIAHGR